jgi:hypothetical protein
MKINSDGGYKWTRQIGETNRNNQDSSRGLVVDNNGNVYICGAFSSSNLNFGFDFGTNDIKTNNGGSDIYITKLDSDGNYHWTRTIGGDGNDIGFSVTTDSLGDIYITGYFSGTVNFGKDFGTNDYKTANANARDIFITKISPEGEYFWTKSIGGAANDYGTSIISDVFGNIYIGGTFNSSSVNFGEDFGITDIKSNSGKTDSFVTKINSEGNYLWTRRLGGDGNDHIRSLNGQGNPLAVDTLGNLYVTGFFGSTGTGYVDFGEDFGVDDIKTIETNAYGNYCFSCFVTHIKADGSYGWTKQIGIKDDQYGYAVVVDKWGYLYIAGFFNSDSGLAPVDFGKDFGVYDEKTGLGNWEVFITKIDPSELE